MKFIITGKCLILSIIILLCTSMNYGQTLNKIETQEEFSEIEITSMVKEFCVSYIKENIKEHPNNEKTDSIREKYCTKNLIEQFGNPESNFDSFINAQLFNEELFNSINIKKSKSANDIYFVALVYNKSPLTIKIRVVKENNIYKLDYIFINEYNEIPE